MHLPATSIRPFIGAKDYDQSRAFYRQLGFTETVLSEKMVVFRVNDKLSFYLQDYYAREWIDNTMVFLEVAGLDDVYQSVHQLNLPVQFKNVRLSKIVDAEWGREFFLHDPSGVLWHVGSFK